MGKPSDNIGFMRPGQLGSWVLTTSAYLHQRGAEGGMVVPEKEGKVDRSGDRENGKQSQA